MRTRNEDYTHQYKSISVANTVYCGYNSILTLSLPSDLIEIKNMYCRIVMLCDEATVLSRRKLLWIGGRPETTPIAGGLSVNPTQSKMMFLNASADSSRHIDKSVDISHLLDKLTYSSESFLAGRQPTVEINLIVKDEEYVGMTEDHNGTMVLWKVDFIYTTRGIQ